MWPVAGVFPAQSNAENVSTWWRHHIITLRAKRKQLTRSGSYGIFRRLLAKTSTNRNVDNQNVDKLKRRQTKPSTTQNVDKPKRWQIEMSANRNVKKKKKKKKLTKQTLA